MNRQERFEAPEQHMCEDLSEDGEKRYRSVAGALSLGAITFVKWDDDPISPIRWNTTRQPDPVKERM